MGPRQLLQQQQTKSNNKRNRTENCTGRNDIGSYDEPQLHNDTTKSSSRSVNHTNDEGPQTQFILLHPAGNDISTIESLQHSNATASAVTARDDVERQQQQQHRSIDDKSMSSKNKNEHLGISERSDWGPTLSLPDIDDTSMNYTVLYMEHYKIDLLWAMVSDTFFILGGISYIVLSGWDFHIYKHHNSNEMPIDGSINKWYIAVDLIAPTVYLLNSIIDIYWAEAVRQRLINKQDMTKIWDQARLQLRGLSFTSSSLSSTYDYSNENDVQNCFGCTWCYRIRKYAAHRRTMMAAVSFGIAASLAVVAAIHRNLVIPTVQYEYGDVHHISPWVYSFDSILDALSDHVYIVSALFSMTGKRHRPWLAPSDAHTTLYNDSERLEDLGDLLFLLGSLVDATLSDLQLNHLLLLPILSSVLWMVDGWMYMRSDIVKASKLRDEVKSSHGDTHPIKFIV